MIEILFYALMALGFLLLYAAVTDYLHTRRMESRTEEEDEFIVSEYFGIAVNRSQVRYVVYKDQELNISFVDDTFSTVVAEDWSAEPYLRQAELKINRQREAEEFMQRFNG